MIPSTFEIKKSLTPEIIQYILLHPTKYFQIAEEFVTLHAQFAKETFYEKMMVWLDMVISPILTIIQIFQKHSLDMFAILSIQKTINVWRDWFRWKELQTMMREWVKIVRSIGGPFIACNDAHYHMFVYADGIQRLYDSLLLSISEKRAKCL